MGQRAWTYQRIEDVRDLGADKAPWHVGWYDNDDRRKQKTTGPGSSGEKLAKRLAAKITAELMTGTYEQKTTVLWDDFVAQYSRRILDGLEPASKRLALCALAHFKRHVRPVRVYGLDTGHVDDFIARRRQDPGQQKGETVSPASINKDLRHLRAAFKVAVDWGYLTRCPKFRFERVPKRLVRYVIAEHFAAIYGACDVARLPRDLPYPAADWWRGLVMFAYMTGWRLGDMLALRRLDLDLEQGYAITDAADNKGDRDDRVKLHRVVVEHLERMPSLDPMVFPWHNNHRTIFEEWDRIQQAAGIHLPCRQRHEHSPSCHFYGFHDLRRAFATMNAARLTPDALQALMRHRSYATTQVYINLARQIDDAVNVLYVPEVPARKEAR